MTAALQACEPRGSTTWWSAIARYDDLLRLVADGRPAVQTVAACMAAGMTIEQVVELQLAFPTFTEAVCMAAQKICRTLGVGSFPQVWSYLGPED